MLERVQKILAHAGVASRRECEDYILNNRIKVNGKYIKLGDKADPQKDKITVDDQPVRGFEKKVYVILNKPRGYVTTVSEPFGMSTVLDIINIRERVYPVGRLDKNSEGLLLLTNDGDLTFKLTHPSHGVTKTYDVRLDKNVSPDDTQKLLQGVRIEGRVCHVQKLRRIKPNELIIDIHEGRKHIVRNLFERLGYEVTKLTRLAFGPLTLKNLRPGAWRYLTFSEFEALKNVKEYALPKPNYRKEPLRPRQTYYYKNQDRNRI